MRNMNYLKIKEVCEKTGLTERTVRFYVKQGLVEPKVTTVRNRAMLEFSEQDVQALCDVAVLRKMQFSIAQIILIQNQPNIIPEVVAAQKAELSAGVEDANAAIQALEAIGGTAPTSVSSLADALRTCTAAREIPESDREPNFARFENITESYKREAYLRFEKSEENRKKRRFAIISVLSSAALVLASVLVTLGVTGQFPSGDEAPFRPEDILSEQMSYIDFAENLAVPRAYIDFDAGDVQGIEYSVGGLHGISGDAVMIYGLENGKYIYVTTEVLTPMENELVEELGLEPERFSGDAETKENKLEAVFPLHNGGYCAVYVESDDMNETELMSLTESLVFKKQ